MIVVGSSNPIKIQAVTETLQDYPILAEMQVTSFAASSEVSEQPLSMEEMIKGAKNRAKNAFDTTPHCTYSFGIESGLFEAPGTQTGFLEACICCIYDGNQEHIGLSCGFEIPPSILELVLNNDLNLAEACYHSGITDHPKLGSGEGLIGLLTKRRINRKIYTKQSVMMALIQIENNHWYSKITSPLS